MKVIFKILLISLFFAVESSVFAHNPEHSSLKLIISEKSGFLDISLSQHGVEQALLKKYPDLNLNSIETNKFKELLIGYLKENIILTINDQELKIGAGVIKLGSHQTSLKFRVENFPKEDFKNLEVKATCFQENEKQQTFFSIINDSNKANANLNKSNNYSRKFQFKENTIVLVPQQKTEEIASSALEKLFSPKISYIIPILIIIAIVLFKFLKQKSFEKIIQSS